MPLLLSHGQAEQVDGVLLLLPHGQAEQVCGVLLLLPHGQAEQVGEVLLLLPHGQAEQVSVGSPVVFICLPYTPHVTLMNNEQVFAAINHHVALILLEAYLTQLFILSISHKQYFEIKK